MSKPWLIALSIAGLFGGKAFADCVPSPDTPAPVIEYFQRLNKPLPEQFCAKEDAAPQASEEPSQRPQSSVFAFRTYSQWRAMSLEARTAYIAGAIDSLLFSNPEVRQHYGDCISNAKAAQMALSFATFIDARPNLQGGAVQNGLLEYLIALCDQQPGAPSAAVKPN
jgi:hypothetical protein